MKVYKFKCESCGSTKYDKVDERVYKCSYCGCTEEIQTDKTEESKVLIHHKKESRRKVVEYDGKISRSVFRLCICVMFGAFGIHKFLEGKILAGIIYLFTFGLFGFGVFFDIVRNALQIVHLARMRKYHDDELKELEGGAVNHE